MPKQPTRDQLAKFLPTQELIRAFEQLFDFVGPGDTDVSSLQSALVVLAQRVTTEEKNTSGSELDAAIASARINALSAKVAELQKELESLQIQPPTITAP